MKAIILLALIAINLSTVVEISSNNELKEEVLIGGLHDVIRNYSRASLIKLALKMEQFERNKLNITLFGGLHDYIYSLAKEQIISIIFDFVDRNSELNSISKAEELANIKPDFNEETFDSYLHELDRESLIRIALNCDQASRKNLRNGNVKLVDSIDYLTNEQIIKQIQALTERNPFLLKNEKVIRLPEVESLSEQELEDRLISYPQNYLADLACSCESYKRSITGVKLIGGLHDYAYSLEKERLIEIILDFSNEYPELKKEGYLESMNDRRGHTKSLSSSSGKNVKILDSFEASLVKFELFELKRIALACEQYSKTKLNQKLIGGLHDYIDSLTASQIIEHILNYVEIHPELKDPGYLEFIADVPKGGLVSVLSNKSEAELRKICLKIDSYQINRTGDNRMGGLHDVVRFWNSEQSIDFIRRMIKKFPELLDDDKFFEV